MAQYASYYLASCYAKIDEPKYARSAFYTAYSAGFDEEVSEEALFDYAKLSLIPGADPFNEAVGLLDNFVAAHPKSPRKSEAQEMAIYLLLNAKENDQALERLEAMRNRSTGLQKVYNELLYDTGISHFQQGNYDRAQACFSKIMNSKQSAANKAEACFWMGESAYQLGDHSKAAKYLNQFKDMEAASGLPEYALADYDLGYIHYQKPDYDAAEACFRRFIQSADDTQKDLKTDAYIRLGDCFYMDRNYNNAINYYDLATRISKRNADYALLNMAAAFRNPIGCKGKGFEGLKGALKPSKSAAFNEVRLDSINETTQIVEHHTASFLSFSKASRMMACMSVFDVSMNSQRAKSSGSTS